MRTILLSAMLTCLVLSVQAQPPRFYTAADILLQLKKLKVLGSVLYIAAHPDDENTRLLAYLSNDPLYRTGYLSLTRGDGGQNLIGDEQGIELGLVRTQELLAARRIDGAEQFFSTAYDFGFCKNPEEALSTWGHDNILSDVVWVIRKFRPDVIITRFPPDSRAGHGHHSASSILAREAFDAAADATKFPEQLKQGVTVWQAKRLLWNTYNFGENNTQSEDQFKMDCGGYNPLLGKSYGEIAALSRSQHKSQGFGVAAQRGSAYEYFSTTKGSAPVHGLLDGVVTDWSRVHQQDINDSVECIVRDFIPAHPERTVPSLVRLYQYVALHVQDAYWKTEKLNAIKELIKACGGLYLEATATVPYAVQGDSLEIYFTLNDRLGVPVQQATASFSRASCSFDTIQSDITYTEVKRVEIGPQEPLSQPYWLADTMSKGHFNVHDQQLIGKAENDPLQAVFSIKINGVPFIYNVPVRYKYTDPVKGEQYEPLAVMPPLLVRPLTPLLVQRAAAENAASSFAVEYTAEKTLPEVTFSIGEEEDQERLHDTLPLKKGEVRQGTLRNRQSSITTTGSLYDTVFLPQHITAQYIRNIHYDHIPAVAYFKEAVRKRVLIDLKTTGHTVGYIPGAGDKIPQALEEMGYKVTILKQEDIRPAILQQFDAVVTGVRAYNIHNWLDIVHDTLMDYVKNGGVLLVQYNTNNALSTVIRKIGPYPFTVANKRITDETAMVHFLLPNDPVLNYPNKITRDDFGGWIQERSIYDLEQIDDHYRRILSMKDPGENEQDGSLIVTDYGKGKFVYTGLVFFRELPAGVPGAYRLFANLLAKRIQE